MLLIIEALLFISSALGREHKAAVEGQIYPLDMALNSVDDQYDGCTEKMAHLVKTKYLEREINNSTEFKKAWQEGEMNAIAPEDNLTRNNSIAIYVYTNFDSSVYSSFNMAVHNGKQNYTEQTFKWYSLHFLLTVAIQILTEAQEKCKLTYRGTTVEFFKNVTGEVVRFGSFTSSSLDRTVAKRFGTKSCFEIKTCNGANVVKYSKYPEQKEVLIPPYEKFKVTAVRTRRYQKDLWCDTVYELESSGTRSDLNCSVAFNNSIRFTKYTSTFNMCAFCRCFCRKIRASRSYFKINRFEAFTDVGRLCGCLEENWLEEHRINQADRNFYIEHHQLRRGRLNPTVREMYAENQQLWRCRFSHTHIHPGQEISQKPRCYQFLHSVGTDRITFTLLKPCCRV
ncbi:ecto-ADP-ribosyltransferase 5-like [Megalobrama amblycephala]|uniref:ecto-ADP-ribosyltransferase 5-like n=1 Tax=Megalobrama amblycephala TaxID=75352 RepID=UPI002013E0C2|nr:ecto-ADP-ribosyltransferase 5-like [Megalobrama amblycephala]XP_048036400.1 ecto-ADP-ribosyltransferase 5-like [Megalobrama amblycephala]XP_048036401.1 ecto-ADP-ribosyltransferase 5-like [Megalobrama amblycephala]